MHEAAISELQLGFAGLAKQQFCGASKTIKQGRTSAESGGESTLDFVMQVLRKFRSCSIHVAPLETAGIFNVEMIP